MDIEIELAGYEFSKLEEIAASQKISIAELALLFIIEVVHT